VVFTLLLLVLLHVLVVRHDPWDLVDLLQCGKLELLSLFEGDKRWVAG
jgi:hypothetical protein